MKGLSMDSIQAYYFGTLRLVLGMNYPNHNNGGNRYPLSKSFLLEKGISFSLYFLENYL